MGTIHRLESSYISPLQYTFVHSRRYTLLKPPPIHEPPIPPKMERRKHLHSHTPLSRWQHPLLAPDQPRRPQRPLRRPLGRRPNEHVHVRNSINRPRNHSRRQNNRLRQLRTTNRESRQRQQPDASLPLDTPPLLPHALRS